MARLRRRARAQRSGTRNREIRRQAGKFLWMVSITSTSTVADATEHEHEKLGDRWACLRARTGRAKTSR